MAKTLSESFQAISLDNGPVPPQQEAISASQTPSSTPDSASLTDPPSATLGKTPFTPERLREINQKLEKLSPEEILEWAIANLAGLYQTTAFGLTGLATVDMLSKISSRLNTEKPPKHLVPLIFIDTLYHFPETLALADAVAKRYRAPLHIYTPPSASSPAQFESLYGRELWKNDDETYDYLVKVEPARRAYEELGVQAVLTGRRRSQGGDRSEIPIIETDETGLIKVNPLAGWSFKEVKDYIDQNSVPYNPLLDKGYKSIGDWHSTKALDGTIFNPSGDADERAGRWSGQQKTECGLHKDYFKMRKAFDKKRREAELALRDQAAA